MITLLGAAQGMAGSAASTQRPAIHTEDVELFYKVYEGAEGRPSAQQLQRDYLDRGSPGLHVLARERNVTGTAIADTLSKRPEIYADARRCLAVLPAVRRRLEVALHKLGRLYPQASFPPVTIAVGRGKPVGMTKNSSGVLIGLEALCATDWLNPNVEDRFVHVISHEYGHIEQLPAIADDERPTVLEASLMEGGAELTAELISGDVGYSHLRAVTKGREKQIEDAFVGDEDKTDLSAWLYNSTSGKAGRSRLLGGLSDREDLLPARRRPAPSSARNHGDDRSSYAAGQERLVSRNPDGPSWTAATRGSDVQFVFMSASGGISPCRRPHRA